jgi:hypothetical protein
MNNQKSNMSVIAIILAGVSVLILPPFLGLAAFILGIIATVKKEKLGVLALVLSIVLPTIGMFLGAVVATSMM